MRSTRKRWSEVVVCVERVRVLRFYFVRVARSGFAVSERLFSMMERLWREA